MIKKLNLMKHVANAAMLAVAYSAPTAAFAEVFPNKPIRMIVPASAGGAADTLARLVSKYMAESWKQPIVVENRAGASGIIGIEAGSKASPDGYTALMGYTFMVQAPALYSKLPYDVYRDLQPVMQVAKSPNLFAIPTSLKVKTFQEFVAKAKEAQGKYSFGSNGNGTSAHMQGTVISRRAGMELVHVPFKGSAPEIQALLGDQITSGIVDIGSAQPFVSSGALRVLAVTGDRRLKSLPDVPTFKELGFEGFESVGWFGVFLPANTPQDIVQKYVAELTRIMRIPEVASRIESLGMIPTSVGPDAFAKSMRADGDHWTRMAREGNIRLD